MEEVAEVPGSPERALGAGGGGGFCLEVPLCSGKARPYRLWKVFLRGALCLEYVY